MGTPRQVQDGLARSRGGAQGVLPPASAMHHSHSSHPGSACVPPGLVQISALQAAPHVQPGSQQNTPRGGHHTGSGRSSLGAPPQVSAAQMPLSSRGSHGRSMPAAPPAMTGGPATSGNASPSLVRLGSAPASMSGQATRSRSLSAVVRVA
mmetsp:Transcript_58226/g.125911  ORF Transcript_58226/g.125911 Transcript_58226/m.125911 type:complete len:151 (-) Transcript_58226:182-634(-)